MQLAQQGRPVSSESWKRAAGTAIIWLVICWLSLTALAGNISEQRAPVERIYWFWERAFFQEAKRTARQEKSIERPEYRVIYLDVQDCCVRMLANANSSSPSVSQEQKQSFFKENWGEKRKSECCCRLSALRGNISSGSVRASITNPPSLVESVITCGWWSWRE